MYITNLPYFSYAMQLMGGLAGPNYETYVCNYTVEPTSEYEFLNNVEWLDGRSRPSWASIIAYYPNVATWYYSDPALRSDVMQAYDASVSGLAGKADTSHAHAQSDITGLVSALAGKASSSHSHAISDVTGLQTALDGKIASTVSTATPSRTLNSNFTPSATKMVWVAYTISISCSATIAGGGQTGKVELRSDTSSTPTTVRAWIANTNSVSLAVAVGVVNTQEATISCMVPAGHNVRLVSSGSATISIVAQCEVTIG